MVNDKSYSARLIVSDKVKWYVNNPCKENFLRKYPEYDGAKVTENQIITALIKTDLGLFYLENDEHKQ